MKLVIYCSFVFLLAGCTDGLSGISKPSDLIPRDTMVLILKDMSLLESHIQAKYVHVSRFQETMKRSGKKILDNYHVSHDRYMQSMYTEILDSLNSEAIKVGKNVDFDTSSFQLQSNNPRIKKVLIKPN